MRTRARRIRLAVAAATSPLALMLAGTTGAHHSPIMFDTTEAITISGTVVRFDQINPHSYLRVELDTPEGPVEWSVEGPSALQFERRGIAPDLFAAGDRIEACGYVLKPGATAAGATGAEPRRLLVAEVIVMPDGLARLWSPYGNQKCRDQHQYTMREE